MKLNCVIIDDEPLARECLETYTSDIPFLNLCGICQNPVELTDLLSSESIDLIFLDIQMPVMNGLDFLRVTQNPPMAIITTAYPSYALEGFKLDVLDYLLKPITFDRFFKACNKARDYHHLKTTAQGESKTGNEAQQDYFFIKCEYKYEKIFFDQILYIQAMQNYVVIFTTLGKYMSLIPLKSVEERLEGRSFIRVHKSYIVSIDKIESIENHQLRIRDQLIPISRNFRDQVIEKVVNKRLWKK